jgi:hypothetical protein
MHSLSTFGVRTSHGQTRTHKTHHSLDLGQATTFPPYSILCAFPRSPHPNGFLSRDSQMGVSKLRKLRESQLWGPITLCENFQLKWDLRQSCSPDQELFNNMSHATYTQGNWVNSWLLVVGSQIANLTLNPFFGHNLCFKCPNGWCEPILDIFVSIAFQWYEELFEPLGFDSCNHSLNIWESIWLQLPTWEFTWECEGFFPRTLLHSRGMRMRLPNLVLAQTFASPFALVTSRKLGSRHQILGCKMKVSIF